VREAQDSTKTLAHYLPPTLLGCRLRFDELRRHRQCRRRGCLPDVGADEVEPYTSQLMKSRTATKTLRAFVADPCVR
jgi:hypothetical protein